MRRPTLAETIRKAAALLCLTVASAAGADDGPELSRGQVLYLPIYSHVYHGDAGRDGKPAETLVSTHVSIRNTDPSAPIRILYARYYDTAGQLVKEYLTAPQKIPPLGTHEIFIPRSDKSGGSGANFLIAWTADAPVNPPLIDGLHADIREARGLFFITTARPIRPPAVIRR